MVAFMRRRIRRNQANCLLLRDDNWFAVTRLNRRIFNHLRRRKQFPMCTYSCSPSLMVCLSSLFTSRPKVLEAWSRVRLSIFSCPSIPIVPCPAVSKTTIARFLHCTLAATLSARIDSVSSDDIAPFTSTLHNAPNS